MKTFIFLIVILSLPFSLWARSKGELLILDENIETKSLEKNFNIRRGSTHRSSLPDKGLRDQLLSKVKQTKGWDEYKKDAFFMDLKSKSLKELQAKYPDFSEKELKTLKDKRL
jgi:hypothetical protein